MKKISEALDQYTCICKEAIVDSAAKLSKSFEKVIIEVLLLYMVIPGKINFTQMGRYGRQEDSAYWSFLVGVCRCREAWAGDYEVGVERHRQP